jgi:Peptidase family M28
MSFRRTTAICIQLVLIATSILAHPAANGGRNLIKADEMREWLTYLSSDELEGRSTFSEGLGLAAAYIAAQLKTWGVRPGGDGGSYFQRVRVLGVKSNNHSTITVSTRGQTRTFKNGDGVIFARNVGAKRSFSSDQIEFVGYGLNAPLVGHNDYAGKSGKGKIVVWLGPEGPREVDREYRSSLSSRSRYAIEQEGAIASLGPVLGNRRTETRSPNERPVDTESPDPAETSSNSRRGGSGGPSIERPDFTTAQRLDAPSPPAVSAQEDFFKFLFQNQDVNYDDLKAKASRREPLPGFSFKNMTITINLDAEYKIVRTQFTRNVVGIVEGSDPKLKDTYVAFGAHYDHVGYSEGELVETSGGQRRAEPRGRVNEDARDDRIWNGADDDASGTVTILAAAKAFALGPRPRRSLLFVWHSGEERGLWGSRFFADHPTVPIERIVAHINMDMVGRNRDDKVDEANTIYLVGSDRISTELHNITVSANESLDKPLKLDFELNNPTDSQQVYYRSDHYSYAAKGIPIVFLTTGLHSDYHTNTDSAEKINYEKMARIGQFGYEIGARVASLDRSPQRDNQGARAVKGSSGKL